MQKTLIHHLQKYVWLYILLVVPFVAVVGAKPEWVGRLIVVSMFAIGTPVACFWGAFNPKTKGFRDKSPIINKYGNTPNLLFRVAVGLFGIFFFTVSTLPFLRDIPLLMVEFQPSFMTNRIVKTQRSPSAGGGFFLEGITLEGDQEEWQLLVHAPVLIEGPDEYIFLYLPHSRMILEIRDLNTGQRR